MGLALKVKVSLYINSLPVKIFSYKQQRQQLRTYIPSPLQNTCHFHLYFDNYDKKKRPWALPKPTREKFSLDPLHSSPQPPTLSGAPSPVGSFQMCIWKSQEGGRSVARINSLNSFRFASVRHLPLTLPDIFLTDKKKCPLVTKVHSNLQITI